MKYLKLFLVCFLIGAITTTVVKSGELLVKPIKQVAKEAAKNSPRLGSVIRLVQDGHTYCSGVVIDPRTIITAAHCVIVNTPWGPVLDPSRVIEIRGSDARPLGVYAQVKSASTQIDRAILKGNFSDFAPSKYISDMGESVKVRVAGTQMMSCGYPLGGALFCNKTTYIKEYLFFMTVRGLLVPGMSGGPTMLIDGTVVGINSAVEDDFSVIAPMYNVEMFK